MRCKIPLDGPWHDGWTWHHIVATAIASFLALWCWPSSQFISGQRATHTRATMVARRAVSQNPFDVLGLSRGATYDEIRSAFRSLARTDQARLCYHFAPTMLQKLVVCESLLPSWLASANLMACCRTYHPDVPGLATWKLIHVEMHRSMWDLSGTGDEDRFRSIREAVTGVLRQALWPLQDAAGSRRTGHTARLPLGPLISFSPPCS